jgi:hypothetical protein
VPGSSSWISYRIFFSRAACFREDPAVAQHEDHVRVLDPVDRRDDVMLHRRLELRVQRGDRLAVVLGRGVCEAGAQGERGDRGQELIWHGCVHRCR